MTNMARAGRHLLITGLLSVICVQCIQAGSRVRRQASAFSILSNTSLPCEELTKQEGPGVEILQLSEHDKYQLLRLKGAEYITSYMAATLEEARHNFTSFIDLELSHKEILTNKLGLRGSITKNDIYHYMINYLYSDLPTPDKTVRHIKERLVDAKRRQTYREFMDSIRDIQDSVRREKLYRKWRDASNSDDDKTEFPFVLPSLLGISDEYTKSDGSRVQLQYCLNRGSPTGNVNYLRMCTVCSGTTQLPEGYWPAFVNEATCTTSDDGCLHVDGVEHGMCQQVSAPVQMLQKSQNNKCTLILKDGARVVAEEWNLVTYMVSVGCDCTINKNSYFADFL